VPMKEGDRWRGQLGWWECVACGNVARCDMPLLAHGWLNYGCGRLCPGCRKRFDALPVGSYVDLGAGCRLVKVTEIPQED
jgi:hypothetical protein